MDVKSRVWCALKGNLRMNKLLVLAALVVSLASCKKDASREVILAKTPDGRAFQFMPIYEDGVTDITITIAWPMTWAFRADENPTVPYIAAQAILSGGTENLTSSEVLETFNDKNSSGQLYVRPDHAIGEVSFPKEHIDLVVPIVGEMLTNPQFDPAWVDRIKQGFLNTNTQAKAQTANQMWDVARYAILGQTPLYNFLSLPNLDAIETVSVDQLRRWHRETLVQNGVTISVTGAISRKDAGRAVDTLLSQLPTGQTQTPPKVQTDFTPKIILLHKPDAQKTTLSLVGQLPPTSQGNDLADLLALTFFKRTGNGPLFDAVRTDLRASYGLQAGVTNYDRGTRLVFIAGEIETAKLAQAADLVRKTYETYRTAPDLTGLDELRQGLAEATAKNVLYVNVAARAMLEFALDGLDPGMAPKLGALLENVTAQDVQDRLQAVFPSGNDLIVIAASPDATALPGACVITEIQQASQCK